MKTQDVNPPCASPQHTAPQTHPRLAPPLFPSLSMAPSVSTCSTLSPALNGPEFRSVLQYQHYEQTRQLSDLDAAISTAEQELSSMPEASPVLLDNLARYLAQRFFRMGLNHDTLPSRPPSSPHARRPDLHDLLDALDYARLAHDAAPPQSAMKPVYLANLGSATLSLWSASPSPHPSHLHSALELLRAAAAATSPRNPFHAAVRAQLVDAQLAAALALRSRDMLDEARELAREAVLPGDEANPQVAARLAEVWMGYVELGGMWAGEDVVEGYYARKAHWWAARARVCAKLGPGLQGLEADVVEFKCERVVHALGPQREVGKGGRWVVGGEEREVGSGRRFSVRRPSQKGRPPKGGRQGGGGGGGPLGNGAGHTPTSLPPSTSRSAGRRPSKAAAQTTSSSPRKARRPRRGWGSCGGSGGKGFEASCDCIGAVIGIILCFL